MAETIQRQASESDALIAVARPQHRALATAACISFLLFLPFSAAHASSPDSIDGPLFSFERARRGQQRQATSASTYRSDVPWPGPGANDGRRRWLRATGGGEWDTKKTLLSNGIGEPDEIADRSFGGGAWFVDVGSEVFRRDGLAAGLAGSYWAKPLPMRGSIQTTRPPRSGSTGRSAGPARCDCDTTSVMPG